MRAQGRRVGRRTSRKGQGMGPAVADGGFKKPLIGSTHRPESTVPRKGTIPSPRNSTPIITLPAWAANNIKQGWSVSV